MRPLALLALLLTGLGAASHPAADPQALVGTWNVDLRPTADAPAYVQPMVVTSVDDGRVAGTFYGSPMVGGRVNTAWDGVYLAFSTSDGSAEYVTTARLLDGVVTGVTYAPARDLLQPWRATRAAD